MGFSDIEILFQILVEIRTQASATVQHKQILQCRLG